MKVGIGKSNYINNFIYIFIGQLISNGISFLKWKLLIDFISVQDFGYYSLILKTILILTPIVSFGISNALIVYVPALISKGKKINDILKKSFLFQIKLFFIFGLFSTLIFFLLSNINSLSLFIPFYFLTIIGVIFTVIQNFLYNYCIALKKNFIAALFYSIQSLISFFILFYYIISNGKLIEILWGMNIALLLPSIPLAIFIALNLKYDNKLNLNLNLEKGYIKLIVKKFSIFFLISNFSYILINNIEPFFLNFFIDIEVSATFSYYLFFISLSLLGSMVTGQVLSPIFSEIYSKENSINKISNTFYFKIGLTFSSWIFLLVMVIILDLNSLFPSLLQFTKFSGNLVEFYTISSFGFFYLFGMTNLMFLTSIQKIHINAYIILISVLILFILNTIFTPIYGIVALIFIKIFCSFLLSIISALYTKKYFSIKVILRGQISAFFIFVLLYVVCIFQINTNIVILILINLIFTILLVKNKIFLEFFKSLIKFKH